MRFVFAVAVIALMIGRHSVAWACDSGAIPQHEIDPAAAGVDTAPPVLPALSVTRVVRGRGPEREGACSWSAGSCDGAGIIAVGGFATDDQTPRERIGYRFALIEGRLPDGMRLPTEALDLARYGEVQLEWEDGDTDDQEPIAFTLEVVAVDAAGNESLPQALRVSDPGSGGCRIGGRGEAAGSGATWLVGSVVVLMARRRRRHVIRSGGMGNFC